jgi:DNA modification methylase
MDIRRIPISSIIPAPYNPRVTLGPNDPEYRAISRSIDEFDNVSPIVWCKRTGHAVGGNQRLAVLKARGATHLDVCVVDLSLEKEKALNLALNKIAGRWDDDKLSALLTELVACPELDVTCSGFSMPEIQDLVAGALDGRGEGEDRFDIDAALEAHEKLEPVTKPGDRIVLGADGKRQHVLCCGDSTNAEHVRVLMEGQKAVLCATDPPYTIDYDGTNRPKPRSVSKRAVGKALPNWDRSDQVDLFERYLGVAINEALLPDAAFYGWYASRRHTLFESAWNTHNILVHQQIIWAKPNAIPGRTWYRYRHEPCLYGWRKGKKPKRFEKDEHSTVWEVPPIGRGTSERPDHPTPKPVLLFEIPMRQHTKPAPGGGELANCYEPFAGSGTQIIAAERLRRRCFAMEMDPRYCDLIVRRFIAYAGDGAVAPEIAERYRLPSTSDSGVIP